MLASPKKVRNTVETQNTDAEFISIHMCMLYMYIKQIDISKLGKHWKGWYCTRKRGEDIDQHSNAGSADDSQHHVVVESMSHLIIKQLCSPIKHLHLAGAKHSDIEFQGYLILCVKFKEYVQRMNKKD